MSITREKKENIVSRINGDMDQVGSVVLADFTGINVEQMTELRRRMREAGVTFTVVKNTLLKRALEEAGVHSDEEIYSMLEGPTAIAYSEDEIAPAKVLKAFNTEFKGIPVLKGGFVSGRTYTLSEVMDLADMPSREELLARVAGSMNAPLRGFMTVTSGVIRKFLYAVNAISESKQN